MTSSAEGRPHPGAGRRLRATPAAGATAIVLVLAVAVFGPAPPATAEEPGDEPSSEIVRVAGADRVETSVEAARAALAEREAPGALDTAVVARADDYPDALAGVPLAHGVDAPLLLTHGDRLAEPVAGFLDEHLADQATVVLLGGSAALDPTVAEALESEGREVLRLAGDDRHGTAAEIARAASDPSTISDRFDDQARGGEPETITLASGETFPDALALSVPAAANGWPLVLTREDELPAPTRELLDEWDVDRVELAGGERAVGEEVVDALEDLGLEVTRTAGAERYETSAALAERFHDHQTGDDTDPLVVATGEDFPDALTGGSLAAAGGGMLALSPADYPPRALGAVLLERTPESTTVLGGTTVLSDRAVDGLARLVGGVGRHVAEPELDPASGATVDLSEREAGRLSLEITDAHGTPTEDSTVKLHAGEQALDLDVQLDDERLTVELTELPEALDTRGEVEVRLSGTLHTREPGEAHGREEDVAGRAPLSGTFTLTAPPRTRTTPEGFEAVTGVGEIVGENGELLTYSLEYEPQAGVDPAGFVPAAAAILTDDERGWASQDAYRLQRVEPDDADIRVALTSPDTTDELCARAGLHTAGRYSCWNGEFAALNAMRWREGAEPFDGRPIEQYRAYLVNHEVGHGLGYGHHACPSQGAPAPVMKQQTISTGACVPNGWPYPQGPAGDP
ncbi:DUF3152 domain-containing protein [Egibacter rhizosphaerae]|uniref:DUF3152 domain-containing protein n=1 Tax=Egibacter rhizosphaerae TaxID=1670831 RepID=A0A411YAS0_9ACTN|nr:cell wall-binding repeat-containing protein [Egibacter rhizosphaerae]QBI18277.1 DUF3152 domain-containing protein [Egibacter rhizosphaerae]